ncbi:MAG TPA: hypothetical protein VJY54_05110 [Lachnospiraceae bacterium]|nr:hypothetical protein [Lachnospiraceae bacterium]
MKRKTICSAAILLLVVFSGCGSKLPQMTYEQEKAIVEYAASTVMQRMEDYNSRLVDLSLYDSLETEPEETEPVGMDLIADTQTIDVSSEESQLSIEEVLSLSDIDFQYGSYEVSDTYPNEETKNPYFTLDASNRKKLLILHFTLQNLAEEDKEVNIFSMTPQFIVTINDDKRKSALSTILLDDISTYVGELSASAQKNLFLIVEIEEETAASIENIKLTVSTDIGYTTIPLQ